jgi:hypothetical protein
MGSSFHPGAGGRRGSVIVLVLGLITLTAFLLSQFIERSLTEMLVESRVRQADRLRADAHSALEASLAVLADYQAIDGGLRAPSQGWGEPLAGLDLVAREGRTILAEIEDESGRISLPRLGVGELVALGRQFGLTEAEAAQLADAMLAWTRRSHATTRIESHPRNYEFADPPHRPPGRPIGSWEELAAIVGAREFFYTEEGRPTALLEEFVRNVSLHSFPVANLNSARVATLALAGLDSSQITKVTAYQGGREGRAPGDPSYFRSMAEARTMLGFSVPLDRFDTLARCLRVRVTVQEGNTVFSLIAVVAPFLSSPVEQDAGAGGALPDVSSLRYPFKLLTFEESIEPAPPSAL